MADQESGAKKRVVSPGISGAIKDAIGAISNAMAPRGIVQRGKKVSDAIDNDSGSPQTSDLGNQF